MKKMMLCAVVIAGALAADGCGGGHDAQPARAELVTPGVYRAVLQSPGGELPFGLELEHRGDGWMATLVNGAERVAVEEVQVDGGHLDIKMPGYENHLSADARGDALTGELVLSKLGGKDQHIPLRAQIGQPYRFFPARSDGAAPADLAGRWAISFTDDGGAAEPAVGEFTQEGDVVTGTVMTGTGDHRFLAGQVRADALHLSTFDGAHVFLYTAHLGNDGLLTGDFWSGTAYHQRFTARRDAKAALADAYSLTTMRPGENNFEFSFPDLSNTTVTSADPMFRNKVLVVALAGSWCPNCHDEAAFLAPLYREYRARGLEVVSLMFEHFGDFERAALATQRFRRHYGIEYTTLIAGISDKDEASKKLPMLSRVYAFPTTILIDRHGRVRKIHTGYTGPATGVHYTQFVAEFRRTLDELLAET